MLHVNKTTVVSFSRFRNTDPGYLRILHILNGLQIEQVTHLLNVYNDLVIFD